MSVLGRLGDLLVWQKEGRESVAELAVFVELNTNLDWVRVLKTSGLRVDGVEVLLV